jgi:membrane fusion protein, macrolide-specific efflux system
MRSLSSTSHQLITALLVFGLCSCFVVPNEPAKLDFAEIRTGDVTYHVDEIKRQDLTNSLAIYGVFRPAQRAMLFFRSGPGMLEDLYVEDSDQVSKGMTLATLSVSGLENQIMLQKIELEKAKIGLELQAVAATNRYVQRLAELDVESAEIRLAERLTRLDGNRIIAPFNGVITRIAGEVGDFVYPFVPFMRLEGLDELVLECDPKSLKQLLEGTVVEVELREDTYKGVVVRSYRDIVALGTEALDDEKVKIEVAGIPADTESGESARVTVVTDEVKNAIAIRKNLVKSMRDRTYVYLLRNGVKVEQDVVVGLETRTRVEITEGLSEGDQLVVK